MIRTNLFLAIVLLLVTAPSLLLARPSYSNCSQEDVEKCINMTSATPSTHNESLAIRKCLELASNVKKARNIRAFVCRCTLKVFQCLVRVNCSYNEFGSRKQRSRKVSQSAVKKNNQSAEEICRRYVRKQDLDCSESLCRYIPNAASGLTRLGRNVMVLMTLFLFFFFFLV